VRSAGPGRVHGSRRTATTANPCSATAPGKRFAGAISKTTIGGEVDALDDVWLTGDTIFDNQLGLEARSSLGSPGVIDSFCDNRIMGNADNGTAPNDGLTTSFAKRLLGAANCKLGKVTKKATRKRSQVGKVMSQKTRAGSTLAQGTAVAVTVS
jgi:hypothetical protein